MKKLKRSTILWILTAVFVLLTAAGIAYIILSPDYVSNWWALGPCVIALFCSSLAARARNEGK